MVNSPESGCIIIFWLCCPCGPDIPQYDVTNHLEESKVGAEDVVEVDLWVLPRDVHLGGLVHAFYLAGNDRRVNDVAVDVDA